LPAWTQLIWNRVAGVALLQRQLRNPQGGKPMLYWSLMFLIVALVAAVFGFGGIASTAAGIAQILFIVALVLFIVSLFASATRRNL
jgi:uncharacterized membrane protein YtjA (UPF0391 family)